MASDPSQCPVRCFLADVSKQGQAASASAFAWDDTSRDSKRRKTMAVTRPMLLRIMGTVVDVQLILEKDDGKGNSDNVGTGTSLEPIFEEKGIHADETSGETFVWVTLDDGTGTMRFRATNTMTSRIEVVPGMTLDCLVEQYHIAGVDEYGSDVSWVARQLVRVTDPHAEALRWLELTYRSNATLNSNNNNNSYTMQWGYPTRHISSDDIYQIIALEGNTMDHDAEIAGVSIQDLSECLELSIPCVEGYIQELQLSGQIYRNQRGVYLPL